MTSNKNRKYYTKYANHRLQTMDNSSEKDLRIQIRVEYNTIRTE